LWKEDAIMTDAEKDQRVIPEASDLNQEGVDSDVELPEGGEPTQQTKPASRQPAANKDNARDAIHLEDGDPNIAEQIRLFKEAELPSCPFCGSTETASVQVGMVGRALTIAASTTKVKLVPSAKEKLGIYFCNTCGKYFN
jgi:hypothetical protein